VESAASQQHAELAAGTAAAQRAHADDAERRFCALENRVQAELAEQQRLRGEVCNGPVTAL
jgi:hypothetical protein